MQARIRSGGRQSRFRQSVDDIHLAFEIGWHSADRWIIDGSPTDLAGNELDEYVAEFSGPDEFALDWDASGGAIIGSQHPPGTYDVTFTAVTDDGSEKSFTAQVELVDGEGSGLFEEETNGGDPDPDPDPDPGPDPDPNGDGMNIDFGAVALLVVVVVSIYLLSQRR